MKCKFSKIGIAIGITIIICSIVRWFFIFYDPSQVAITVSIGLIVCGFAYVYDWMRSAGEEIQKVNKRLDTFTDWWTRQEMK